MNEHQNGLFLKCDADGCDHQEQVEDMTEDLIDKPCPKCGSNLLTREDFLQFVPIRAALAALDRMGFARMSGSAGVKQVSVNHHNGTTTITEINK